MNEFVGVYRALIINNLKNDPKIIKASASWRRHMR
jgi:hypothetical protein